MPGVQPPPQPVEGQRGQGRQRKGPITFSHGNTHVLNGVSHNMYANHIKHNFIDVQYSKLSLASNTPHI